jgi:hypothetical protein
MQLAVGPTYLHHSPATSHWASNELLPLAGRLLFGAFGQLLRSIAPTPHRGTHRPGATSTTPIWPLTQHIFAPQPRSISMGIECATSPCWPPSFLCVRPTLRSTAPHLTLPIEVPTGARGDLYHPNLAVGLTYLRTTSPRYLIGHRMSYFPLLAAFYYLVRSAIFRPKTPIFFLSHTPPPRGVRSSYFG